MVIGDSFGQKASRPLSVMESGLDASGERGKRKN